MTYVNPEALVSADWLAANIKNPDLRIVDASHFISPTRNADEEFAEEHIPGAVRFDIDTLCDADTDVPHMLPSAEKFAALIGAMGIGDGHHVVCYDTVGVATAACRAWWMFRVFGHARVSVLDGGFPAWLRGGFDVEGGAPKPDAPAVFTARRNASLVRSIDQIVADMTTRSEQLLDARSLARFDGEDPEPRPSKRLGHIPGSSSLPFLSLLNSREMTFLDAPAIAEVFTKGGVNLEKPITTTCGSGVTACVVALALYLIGRTDIAVYDGSWAEWNQRLDLPIEARIAQPVIE